VCCIDEYGDFIKKITNPRSPATQGLTRVLKEAYSVNLNYTNGVEWAAKKSDPVYFPSMSIVGFSTFEQFFDAVSGKEIKDGFINRHLLIATHKKSRAETDWDVQHDVPTPELLARLEFLRDSTMPPGDMGSGNRQNPIAKVAWRRIPWSLDGSGEKTWREIDEYLAPMVDAEEDAEFWQRTKEHVLKLALIHAASRLQRDMEIAAVDVVWAGQMAIWSTQQMIGNAEEFMSENDAQREYKLVLGLIRKQTAGGKSETTRTRLAQSLKGRLRSRQMDDTIKALTDDGTIVVVQEKTTGAPRTVIRLR
jgi:hypothetical protein